MSQQKRKYESLQVEGEDLDEQEAPEKLSLGDEEFDIDKISNESSELEDNPFQLKPTDLSVDLFNCDENTDGDAVKMSKRQRLCLNDSLDSPCSSSNSSLDVRDVSDSPPLTGVAPPRDHTYVAHTDSQSPTLSFDIPEIISTDNTYVADTESQPTTASLPEIISGDHTYVADTNSQSPTPSFDIPEIISADNTYVADTGSQPTTALFDIPEIISTDNTYVADTDSQPTTALFDIPEIIALPDVIDLSTPARQGQSNVVDLTAEPMTPTFVNDVVDLTGDHTVDNTDSSPVIISVNKIYERPSVLQQRPSCRFASAASNINGIQILNIDWSSSNPVIEENTNKSDDSNKSAISCPICFDDINVLKRRKRQLNSTICGHVFCDKCITNAIKTQNKCPTCRKKLSLKQIHPLFI